MADFFHRISLIMIMEILPLFIKQWQKRGRKVLDGSEASMTVINKYIKNIVVYR